MTNKLHNYISDFLGKPLTSEEIEALNFPPNTVRRVRVLLSKEAQGKLTPLETIQLEAFKEAAFFSRLGKRRQRKLATS